MLRHIKGVFGPSIVLGSLLLGSALLGQTGTSSISGTITDPQDRPVAGAKVTLTNVATNVQRSMQSTDSGGYVFDFITPADYRLEVEVKGFNKTTVNNVRALIAKQTESNVQLSIGTV